MMTNIGAMRLGSGVGSERFTVRGTVTKIETETESYFDFFFLFSLRFWKTYDPFDHYERRLAYIEIAPEDYQCLRSKVEAASSAAAHLSASYAIGHLPNKVKFVFQLSHNGKLTFGPELGFQEGDPAKVLFSIASSSNQFFGGQRAVTVLDVTRA